MFWEPISKCAGQRGRETLHGGETTFAGGEVAEDGIQSFGRHDMSCEVMRRRCLFMNVGPRE